MLRIEDGIEVVLPNQRIFHYHGKGVWEEYTITLWQVIKDFVCKSHKRYQPVKVGQRFYTPDHRVWNCFNRNEMGEVEDV